MKKLFIIYILFILIATSITTGFCEGKENSSKNSSFFALPFIMYTSDIGLGAGAGALKSYHTTGTKASTLQLHAMYTTKKQFQAALKWEHYLLGSRDRMLIHFEYVKFPTKFFGLGNNTSNDHPETYTPEHVEAKLSYEKIIVEHFKIKAIFLIRNQSLIKSMSDGILKSSSVPWGIGRFDAGPGFGILWDSRDNTYATKRGMLAKFEYMGIMLQDEGGAFNFISFEVKKFFNPFSEYVMGYMFRLDDCRGDTPFYFLADIGGSNRLRGYEQFRFLGKNSILFQHDIHFPIWRNIGGAAFIASGRVADKISALFSGTYHTGCGLGLRYFINKEDNLTLRLDTAFGSDSRGVYITFAEAF